MTRQEENPWLHRFAWVTTAATLGLIGLGGLVTSHGVGMAVPDWPTTYGYNMFLFPVSQWVGGIFYEHTHRLYASFIGLLTTVLAVWLWVRESRRWLRWTGVVAFASVVMQGVLGGLRVTLYKDGLGIVHATLAQLFFLLVGAIALFTSRWWIGGRTLIEPAQSGKGVHRWVYLASGLILLQLTLGASMRHAGLAIPDFPLAYGRLWPKTDEASLALANQRREEVQDLKPILASHIHLHMAHRIGALCVVAAVVTAAWKVLRRCGRGSAGGRVARGWVFLVLSQGLLGAATVWFGKAADVATSHVVVGALCFGTGAWLGLALHRSEYVARCGRHRFEPRAAGLVVPLAVIGTNAEGRV
jgi:heme a synthase